jgi:YVTN family beta-propeller protein
MLRTSTWVSVALFLPPALAAAAEPAARGRQKLYVTNSSGNDVTVFDVATLKRLGRIEVGPHPHGIAVPAAQDKILVTVEGSRPGRLVWIDPRTDKVVRRMNVGPGPNQLAVTPDGKIAYVPVADGHWEVIDLDRAEIVRRIRTGGRPHNTVCSADGKHMYLAAMGDVHKVVVVDVATHTPDGEIRFSNVVRPITVNRADTRLYAEVDGLLGFEVADVAARRMVQRIADRLTPEERKAPSRSHGIAIRPDQKELWECDVMHQEVHVFDLRGDRPRQTDTIPIGSDVYWLTFGPDGKRCYVAALGADSVAVVDTASKKIVRRLAAGREPKRLLIVTVLPEAGRKN